MKITNQQYAQALYQATKGKSQKEIDSVIADFLKILIKDNKLKNINQIINKFDKFWSKEEGIVEAQVISRKELSGSEKENVEKFVRDKYKAEKVLINNIVDEKIKGGIIIQVGDEVLDGSIERQLKDLKNKLAN